MRNLDEQSEGGFRWNPAWTRTGITLLIGILLGWLLSFSSVGSGKAEGGTEDKNKNSNSVQMTELKEASTRLLEIIAAYEKHDSEREEELSKVKSDLSEAQDRLAGVDQFLEGIDRLRPKPPKDDDNGED